jgi:hypothetical protein
MPTKKAATKKRIQKTSVKTGPILEQLNRVRALCLALPNTQEKLSHGEPTFFTNTKVFAMFSDNHHNDGHISVIIPASDGEQATLIKEDPATYYRPPYVAIKGWIGIDLHRMEDEPLSIHIHQSWKLINTKRR